MDDLADLVKALSPVEKQHFKRRHNPTSDFVMLFDYVNKNGTCRSSEVITYLSKKRKGKKEIGSSYLSVVKTYLKDRILESLRIQFIHKRKNYELLSKSMNADILLEKGLYSMALSEVEIWNKDNLQSSFPIERLLLSRRKSLLDYYLNYSKTSIKGIEALYKSRLETAEQLTLEIKFARILSILSFQYFHGQSNMELLKDTMKEPFMQDESLSTDFTTKYLFHWVHAQIQELNKNPEKALEHFNKSIELWVSNSQYIEAQPRMYLGACFAYFKYIFNMENPFSNILPDINFKELLSKLDTIQLSHEEEEKYRLLFLLAEILSVRKQRKYDEILKLLAPLLKQDEYLSRLPYFDKIIIFYYSALAHFDCGNHRAAGNILNEILNPADKRLANNPVYISAYVMLHTLALFELGSRQQLRYLLPKYKVFLKKEGKLGVFEVQFFNMISQLISPRYESTIELVYQRFFERLNQAKEEDQRGLKIEYEYLLQWVGTKVNEYTYTQ